MTAAQALSADLPSKKKKHWPEPHSAVLRASDMQIGDDGHGNAVLTFPDGESLTIVGIAPTDLTLKDALAAIDVAGLDARPLPMSQDGTVDLHLARAKRRRLTPF